MRVLAKDLPNDKKERINAMLIKNEQAYNDWFECAVCYHNATFWEKLMDIFYDNIVKELFPKYEGIEEIIPNADYENDGRIILEDGISVYPEEFEKDIPQIQRDLEGVAKKSTQDYYMYLRDLWEDTMLDYRDDMFLADVYVDLDDYGNIVGYEYMGEYYQS